jgi:tryptophanase
LRGGCGKRPLIFTCITNNPVCGQAVSMANLRAVSEIAHKYNIPYMLRCRPLGGKRYFIKMNEDGYADKSIAEIATEMFSYCDGFTMSA